MNIERAKANEELDKLKNKYSLECNTYKTNLEECNKEIANLKSEVLSKCQKNVRIPIFA